jgi:hypothetical protein
MKRSRIAIPHGEARMAKLSLALMTLVLLVGLRVKADASTLTGVGGRPALTKNFLQLKPYGALADPVDVPATAAGFGVAGGIGDAAYADGVGKSHVTMSVLPVPPR